MTSDASKFDMFELRLDTIEHQLSEQRTDTRGAIGTILDQLVNRLESDELQIQSLKAEVRASLDAVCKSLNLLRESVLDLHQSVRELIEDRRTLEARTTLVEMSGKKLETRIEDLEKRI